MVLSVLLIRPYVLVVGSFKRESPSILSALSAPTGLPEDCTVQTPAFTDAVRLYRQAKGHYGTWDMMCGIPPQVRISKARSPKVCTLLVMSL